MWIICYVPLWLCLHIFFTVLLKKIYTHCENCLIIISLWENCRNFNVVRIVAQPFLINCYINRICLKQSLEGSECILRFSQGSNFCNSVFVHQWPSKTESTPKGKDLPPLLLELITFHKGDITKTCLYNSGSLKPHFYIVKLWFTGVYNILSISAQKHRLCVLVRTASSRRF